MPAIWQTAQPAQKLHQFGAGFGNPETQARHFPKGIRPDRCALSVLCSPLRQDGGWHAEVHMPEMTST